MEKLQLLVYFFLLIHQQRDSWDYLFHSTVPTLQLIF